MNKIEYLDALKDALKNTDVSIMDEIISDYEEHFQVGLENGKTEEQICEELGSIEDLVNEIKEVYKTESKSSNESAQKDKNKKFGEWKFSFDNLKTDNISNAINNVVNTATEAIKNLDVDEIGRNVKKTVEQATSTFSSFADDYIKNQGNPFDSNRRHAEGSKENVSKSFDDSEEEKEDQVSFDLDGKVEEVHEDDTSEIEFLNEVVKQEDAEDEENTEDEENIEADESMDTEEVDHNQADEQSRQLNLSIDAICADVYVKKSQNGKLNISYENNGSEKQKQMYEFYSYKQGDTVYAGIRKVGKAVFFFNFAANTIAIHVELPDYMNEVKIKSASGDVSVAEIFANTLNVSTASGDVSTSSITVTDCRLKTSSGDIKLEHYDALRSKINTASGDITATFVKSENTSIKSASGDITVNNISGNILELETHSGSSNITETNCSECKVRSSSGDIYVDRFTMNYADLNSMSGTVKLHDIVGDGLRSTTASGDIRADINVKKCHASSKSGDVDVICNGDINLEASATSGDVNVQLKNYGNGYLIRSRTTSGGLYIKYQEEHHRNLKSGTYTYGKQSSELILGSISGNIRVND